MELSVFIDLIKMQLNIYIKQEFIYGELTLTEILFGALPCLGPIDVNFGINPNYIFRTSATILRIFLFIKCQVSFSNINYSEISILEAAWQSLFY